MAGDPRAQAECFPRAHASHRLMPLRDGRLYREPFDGMIARFQQPRRGLRLVGQAVDRPQPRSDAHGGLLRVGIRCNGGGEYQGERHRRVGSVPRRLVFVARSGNGWTITRRGREFLQRPARMGHST